MCAVAGPAVACAAEPRTGTADTGVVAAVSPFAAANGVVVLGPAIAVKRVRVADGTQAGAFVADADGTVFPVRSEWSAPSARVKHLFYTYSVSPQVKVLPLQHCFSVPEQVALPLAGPHLPSHALRGSWTGWRQWIAFQVGERWAQHSQPLTQYFVSGSTFLQSCCSPGFKSISVSIDNSYLSLISAQV